MKAKRYNTMLLRRILVICTASIGDVLLCTPVIRSLKARWPDAAIDVLVFEGTAGMLEGNPDISRIVSIKPCANAYRHVGTACALWRKYDLACALRTSSVASFLCWAAGRLRIGLVSPGLRGRLKKLAVHYRVVEQECTTHVIEDGASLMRAVGIEPSLIVAPPVLGPASTMRTHIDALLFARAARPLAVLHLLPRHVDKAWHIEGWRALLAYLQAEGYAVVLTGGDSHGERDYAKKVSWGSDDVIIDLVGKLTLAGTAEVIRQASLFVGPDTSVSHLAAAIGTPTVVLFGPTNPVRWGPWPQGWTGLNPWLGGGSARRGNVYLLRGDSVCPTGSELGVSGSAQGIRNRLSSLTAEQLIKAIVTLPCVHALHALHARRHIEVASAI